jgi:TPR repeat protein
MRENAEFVEPPQATDEMAQSMREDLKAASYELKKAEKRGSEDLQELYAEVANKRQRLDRHVMQLRADEIPDAYYGGS